MPKKPSLWPSACHESAAKGPSCRWLRRSKTETLLFVWQMLTATWPCGLAFRSDVQIGFWIPPAEYIHDTKHRISEGHHLLHRVKHLGIKTMSFVYPCGPCPRFQSMFRICPNGVWRLSQSYHIPLDLFVGQRLNSPKKKYSHICSSSVQCWLKTSSPDLDNLGSPCSQWSGQIEWLESQGEGRVLRRRRHGRRSALMTQPDP